MGSYSQQNRDRKETELGVSNVRAQKWDEEGTMVKCTLLILRIHCAEISYNMYSHTKLIYSQFEYFMLVFGAMLYVR